MDGSASEDGSLGPESLTLGLPSEGGSDLQELMNENRLLKENLAESSSAMKLACEKLAAAHDQFNRERQEFEEKCREAKEVVTALREEVQQKNDLIETMKLQADEEVKYDNLTDSESVKSRLAVAIKSLESATQERDELKNKYVALEMHFDSEVAHAKELRQQDRQTIARLKKMQAEEINEKQELSDSRNYMRDTFDKLILEYEKIVTDEKMNKAALVTKDGQIQHLQQIVQHLERNCLALQTQVQMCRSEFEGERNAHEHLKSQYITLKATLEKFTMPRDGQRFAPAGPSSLSPGPASMKAAPFSMKGPPRPKNEVCVCPKCGHKAQNIETLYQHSRAESKQTFALLQDSRLSTADPWHSWSFVRHQS